MVEGVARGSAKDPTLAFITVSFLALLGITLSALDVPVAGFVVATVIFLFIAQLVDSRNAVQMMFLLGYSSFLYFPAILNAAEFGTSFDLFYLSSVPGVAFLNFTRGLVHVQQARAPKGLRGLFMAAGVFLVMTSIVSPNMAAPAFALFTMLFAMSLGSQTLAANSRALIAFLAVLAVYTFVGWNGFGRTVIASWMFVALLYYSYARGLRVSKALFTLVPTIGVFFATSRELIGAKFTSLEAVLNDSAFAPYRLASTFLTHADDYGIDFRGFFDQVIFTLFVYIPRSIWPTKPYGFGFEYTVKNLGSGLASAGHSIAATFIGEHLYYLGYWGVITSLLMAYLIAALCRITYHMASLRGFGVVVVASSIPVLLWGGMTSFSARLALPLLVTLALIPLIRIVSGAPKEESGPASEQEMECDILPLSLPSPEGEGARRS